VIFGFFKKNNNEPQEEEEEVDPVRFLGAANGKDANLSAHQRLADAGLVPAKDVVTDALARRAETIRVEPKGPQYAVALLIDGMAQSGGRLSKVEGSAVCQILKLLAGLDPKLKTSPQSGAIKAEFEGKKYLLEVKSQPVADGERVTVRAHDSTIKRDTLTDLGMAEPLRQKIRSLCSHPGAVFVVGPSGSGTTTSLFATLRNVDTYMYTACTLGDIGGRTLPNISPFEANPGDSLETTIQRAYRKETNILCIDKCRKEDTAAIFKHLDELCILTEFEARDAAAGVVQLLEWLGGDREKLVAGLRGILSQKLLRVLCNDCKQAFRPKPEFIKKAGLPAGTETLYRKPPESAEQDPNFQPCETCGMTGYRGRLAVFEFLEMTEDMKKLVLENPDASALRSQMRKEKMTTLAADALRLVAEGKTSLEEVQRVFASDAGKK
jgi:type IV pilus assembly protein PilB